jgi:hypothetical protein
MKKRAMTRIAVVLAGVLLVTSACIELNRVSSPSASSDIIKSLSAGLWSSNGGINPSSCGNFQWQITELTSSTAKGTFGATCAGGITLTGEAEGTLSGSILNWKASGAAATPVGNCPFTANGTATLEGQGVRVNYTINTCVGAFSGSELLKK